MSQEREILHYLKDGNTLTPIDALNKFGCFRLGARIMDLKKEGHNIVNDWESSGGKKYAKYRLIPEGRLF